MELAKNFGFRAVAVVLLFVGSVASAEEQDSESAAPGLESPQTDLAKEYFRSAERDYAAGQYAAAVQGYKKALDLSGRSELHFNVANAYERLGDYAAAAVALRRYREQVSRTIDLPPIDQRLRSLEERAESQRRHLQELERLRAFRVENEPILRSLREDQTRPVWGPWLTGAAGALLVGSLITGLLSRSQSTGQSCSQFDGDTFCLRTAREALSKERRLALTSDVLLSVGLATAVGASVSWWMEVQDPRTGTAVSGGVMGRF